MASWQAILGCESQAPIPYIGPHVRLYGEYAAVVCFEVVGGNNLIATNISVKEERAWKSVHHQSGPTAEDPPRAMRSEEEPIRIS